MPVITVGRLGVEDVRVRSNGETRWIKGTVRLHASCFSLLSEIHQRKLPFTIVTGQVLPKEPAILMGEITTYPIPNTDILWKTLEIQKFITKDSPLLDNLGVTFSEAVQKIARKDPKFLKAIGSAELTVRKQITDLLGTRNKFADTLIEQFGDRAYVELKENPWKMVHIVPYFTIDHADKVAEQLGIPTDSPKRFREYFRYLLDQSFQSHRNTYMTKNEFLAFYWMHFSETMSLEDYKRLAITEGAPIKRTELGYHPAHLYYAEKASYEVAIRSLETRIPTTVVEQAITERVLDAGDLKLTREQIHAVRAAFHTPLHIITGGPGTGKTTTLETILRKLILLTGSSPADEHAPFLLAAPTGKAAFRMWEQTGITAHTLHSAFGIVPEYGCVDVEGTAKRLSHVRYLIIDEASMLDASLFGNVCQVLLAMDHIPFLLLVGDEDQLPPVQHGQVFIDLLRYLSEAAPEQVTKLTILKRQKDGSHIPELADYIRHGKFPDASWFAEKEDVFFVPATMDTFPNLLTNGVLKPKADSLDTIQILTPYRSGNTPDTIHAINALVEPLYNPDAHDPKQNEPSVTVGNPPKTFRVGDKVINRVNYTKTIINGSMGWITNMNTVSRDIFAWTLDVEFDGGDTRTYTYDEFKSLEPAYAITVHASQGSEYENVVLCVLRGSGNRDFLTRNLLYVAVSRASKRLMLLGSIHVFQQMAATGQKPRLTALSHWLAQELKQTRKEENHEQSEEMDLFDRRPASGHSGISKPDRRG